MSRRKTFAVGGYHPLLLLCRDYLIQIKKFELVPCSDSPDFVLFGAALSKKPLHDNLHRISLELEGFKDTPAVILSTSSMHRAGDEGSLLSLSNKDQQGLFSLLVESSFTSPTIIRPFNVYGPDVSEGVIPTFLRLAKAEEPLTIRGNGYQMRAFLHQTDFLEAFGNLLDKPGIHTVGRINEVISIKKLAISVWRSVHGATSTPKLVFVSPGKKYNSQFKVCPTETDGISLRKGIWLMLQ